MKTRFFTAPFLAVLLGLTLGACFDSPIVMEEQAGAPENQGNPDENTFAGGESPAADSLGTPQGVSDSAAQNPHVGSGNQDADTTTTSVDPDNPEGEDQATLGSTWIVVTSATSLAVNKTLFDVVWGGGRFVAVGEDGTILSSADGDSWTAATSGVSSTLRAIVWAPPANAATGQSGLFVAVGDYGTVLVSFDAQTWTQVVPGAQGAPGLSAGVMLTDVAWNGTVFATVGYEHFGGPFGKVAEAACCVPRYRTRHTIATSSDGITWVERLSENDLMESASPSTDVWQAVAVGGDGRLMALKGPGSALTSPDGINWAAAATVGSGDFASLAWGGAATGQGWVAVGDQIRASADGVAWQQQGGPGRFLNAVVWTGSRFVAVGASGAFLVSDDLGTWTLRSTGTNLMLNGVAYRTGIGLGARLVAVGRSGTIVRSP